MEKRIVRLTESDLEKLVKRIIKEDENEPVSSTDLKRTIMAKKQDVASGLSPDERMMLDKVINVFIEFFSQPGNQAVGKVETFLQRIFDEMGKKMGKI